MFSAGAVSGVRARKPLSAGTTSSTATGFGGQVKPTTTAAVAILPPNVNSRPHGKLTVRFGEFHDSSGSGLRWNSGKVYVSVDLQLLWWGQPSLASGATTTPTTLHWEQGNNRQNRASEAVYEVRTNPELFRRYLKSCEPVRVRLVSTRTQTLIGTAQVAIPGKFTNLRESGNQPITAQARGEVLSVRGFCLGELCLELTLEFDRKGSVGSASTVTSQPSTAAAADAEEEKENTKMILVESNPIGVPGMPPLAVEGKPAPLHESSQRAQPAVAKKRFHTLDLTARQKILDYLTGKPFDGDDGCTSELSALSEICSISPAESMLEALARYDRAAEPGKHSYLRTVDCVRVLVENLKFTRAGQKEIQHRARRQELAMYGASFAVRMKLTETGTKTAPTITRLKFCSSAASESEVTFDVQPQVARLSLPELSNSRHGNACFEFAVHLNVGSFYKARLFYLGSAQITLEELIAGRLACYKRCPIRLASDDILLGTLTVRLELGKRGLHFGPDLIDAVLIDGGNVTLEEDEGQEESEADDDRSVTPEAVPALIHCARRHLSPVCFDRCHHEKVSDRFACRMMTCSAAVAACPGDNQSPSETRDQDSTGNQHPLTNGANQENTQPPRNGTEQGNTSDGQGSGEQQPKPMETDGSSPGGEQPKLLHGLLYLGQLKERAQPPEQHFLVCHPFWSEEPSTLTSELCQPEGDFNYLRTFPVLPSNEFLERVRNQHMRVELWQKAPGEAEKLVGLARLPLHQFYIAFRDAQLSEHLAHARLPVISIDGWTSIGSPLAAEPCGQVQAVLAIGTESQIDLFRASRQLPLHTSGDVPRTYQRSVIDQPMDGNGYTTTRSVQGHKQIPSGCGGGCTKQPQTSEVANMLSAFIENLAQRLPISSERSTAPSFDHNSSLSAGTGGPEPPLSGSPHSQANRPQLRKTADLLDNLQKALAQRPSAAMLDGMGMLAGLAAAGRPTSLLAGATTPADQTPPAAGTDETPVTSAGGTQPPSLSAIAPAATVEHRQAIQVTDEHPEPASSSDASVGTDTEEHKLIRLSIEIERAVNLPKLTISKKYAKRHKARPSHSVPEALLLEPSAYATFEGHNLKLGSPNTVKSHEGIVYTTHVIERSCAPGWQKRFEVQLPSDLMTNDEKRFIVKVWRKAALSDAPKCRLLPAPMEDAVIGFCAIDLALLLSGLSSIMGWYNIMDFSGRCNGQIKICIKPLEDVQPFKVTGEPQHSNFRLPLSIDVDCEPSALGLDASCNTSLSRALKRKFTELEEITERLKARLFDVTGDDNDDDIDGGEDDDGAIDPDDEFERDLNTVATEDDDDDEGEDDGSINGFTGGSAGLPWSAARIGDSDQFGDTSNRKRNSQYPNGAMTRTTNTSSYSMCATDRSSLTGCSNRDSPRQAASSSSIIGKRSATATSQLQLEQLLQSHDIETLINPAILKNLLHPSIDSESTPELGGGEEEDGGGTGPGTDAEMQSDDSSSLTNRLPGGTVRTDPSQAPTAGNDRVKQIAKALQRTTISDATTSASGDDGNVTMQGDDAGRVAEATTVRCREAPEGEPMKDVSK